MKRDFDNGRRFWSLGVLKRWLDADFQISDKYLRSKGWSALAVADSMNPMEAEWFADAMQGPGIGLAFEYGGEPCVEDVPASRDGILAYNGRNSWRYVLVTPYEESFVYYKDNANRFYLLCGDIGFISRAYRCTWDTARMMYLDQWVNLEHHSEEEKRFMTNAWNKYAGLTSTC